ncbi:hypothetical protein CE143_10290 [Photorhabdus luminescens]|uniref:Uncharacterized protein n=1 Tax=Photorhabdus akhurstii TaxID=171438 RepID=A0ABX8LUT6_9GAMM|nr:hypothetical protein KS18_05990 [Photorhabdus luminescens]PQQ39717.1 hypothetical protein C6H65_19380 [Photorhabdus luminescens]QXF33505.1 hypothetical protein B0X70_10380 [Photorhabdus akhurstii]UJD75302.1 hypothetical protein CE143_10290 [Photorhabdus luminescens]
MWIGAHKIQASYHIISMLHVISGRFLATQPFEMSPKKVTVKCKQRKSSQTISQKKQGNYWVGNETYIRGIVDFLDRYTG